MSKAPLTYAEEIDLISLIQSVWDGKWKIASIISISLLSVYAFNIVNPNKIFTAKTDIKPITSVEFDKYRLFNSSLKIIEIQEQEDKTIEKIFNIFEITPESLFSLYIEKIEEGSLLEIGIDKFNLFNKEDFENKDDYRDAVEKFASEIKVLKPIKEENKTLLPHVLSVEYDNEDKWKQLLTFVNEQANQRVKASIINRFATIVSIQNQKKRFAIKDIELKIDNVIKDYDRNTKDRLAFLAEQAAIARKLDIQKNTIASQRFNTQNTFVTNVKTDAPFYLRGYVAIEEEIILIKKRSNKLSFIKNLYELEQEKRDLEQDKTIERAVYLFNKTPLNQDNFQSTIVKVATTDYEKSNNRNFYYAFAIVLGGMIGIFYAVIAGAFNNRKKM